MSKSIKVINSQVIVVGAGPVGLSLSVMLGRLGVKVVLIDKKEALIDHPKARSINARTVEIFDSLKLLSDLNYVKLPDAAKKFTWKESFQGADLVSIKVNENDIHKYSPVKSLFVGQNFVENTLLDTVKKIPNVKILFSHELLDLKSDLNGVSVTVNNRKTQNKEFLYSNYLVAADGGNSFVRHILDIEKIYFASPDTGCCNVYCDIDLSAYVSQQLSAGYFFLNPLFRGCSVLAVDGVSKWLFGFRYQSLNHDQRHEQYSDFLCIQKIKQLIGDNDLKINIISKNFWKLGASVLSQFRQDRILFAGDSAHAIPPTGGLGMNTGIQDAHNLAWKLHLVLNKKFLPQLLNTYHEERNLIAKVNIEYSLLNARRLVEINSFVQNNNLEGAISMLKQHDGHLNHLGVDLGFKYNNKFATSYKELFDRPNNYSPSIDLGARAPHAELEKGNKNISTINLCNNNKNFVLFLKKKNNAWFEAAQYVATNLGIMIEAHVVNFKDGFKDKQGDFEKYYLINSSGAVLIRPDGHVLAVWDRISSDTHCRQYLLDALNNFSQLYN